MMRFFEYPGGAARIFFDANGDAEFCDVFNAKHGTLNRTNAALDDILNDHTTVEISSERFMEVTLRALSRQAFDEGTALGITLQPEMRIAAMAQAIADYLKSAETEADPSYRAVLVNSAYGQLMVLRQTVDTFVPLLREAALAAYQAEE